MFTAAGHFSHANSFRQRVAMGTGVPLVVLAGLHLASVWDIPGPLSVLLCIALSALGPLAYRATPAPQR